LVLSLGTAVLVAFVVLRPGPTDPLAELANIEMQIEQLSSDISSLSDDVQRLSNSGPEPVDLSSIEDRLNDLARQVDGVSSQVSSVCGAVSDLASSGSSIPRFPTIGC
jgi:outer membrane murein-binding lipoprotein Lpp